MSALGPEALAYSDVLAALSAALVEEQAAVFAGKIAENDLDQQLDWVRAARHRYVLSRFDLQHRGLGPQSLTEEAS